MMRMAMLSVLRVVVGADAAWCGEPGEVGLPRGISAV
jgi:hypothetical protein